MLLPEMAQNSKDKMIYLHGDLDLHIIEARHLPDMDSLIESLRSVFCRTTSSADAIISSSGPYVTVSVSQATLARTRTVSDAQIPRWNERFNISLAHPLECLEFWLKDDGVLVDQSIGTVRIPAEDIASGKVITGWFALIGANGKPPKPDTALRFEMKFIPCDRNPLYKHGIAGDQEQKGVRQAYFPLRKGHSVTLYQDAHASHDAKSLPEIKLDDGMVYKPQQCWEDICYAISEAQHLIYIAGWDIHHKVKLVREPTRPLPQGGDWTLGKLLKYKSQSGVRVLVLAWEDHTSQDLLFYQKEGVMKTRCREIEKFFRESSVICMIFPRYTSFEHGIKRRQDIFMFAHHQKCVLVDTPANGNNRKITAFIGGLDLCNGRYDTPEHRLFRDQDTVFKDDFHQPTFPPGTKAPRQPWHDLHCKIEGPAAYDVLINFAQRWKSVTRKWRKLNLIQKSMSYLRGDAMIKIEDISWILSPTLSFNKEEYVPADDPKLYVSMEDHPGNWHVQIFRSIESSSVKGFPKYYEVAETNAQNLTVSKTLVIERSIHSAYIQAIRSAQHFIYIENQYFIGSSYAWSSSKDAGADHQIPLELALKIASKIRAKERFVVYVVIPMWPEGDPKSNTMQEILFWQKQTMQMMYRVISEELKSMKIVDFGPLDYLNFYCLGNREEIPSSVGQSSGVLDKVSDSMKFKRFMVYVHAKGMIVDDEYIILGSANINQRSMDGSRDSEIAMGAYQPHHTWSKRQQHPHGQIYGYRMSLWAEHVGRLDECFEEPETLDCVKKLNEIAKNNWKKYTADEFTPLQGHLLKYPIDVDAQGQVGPLPGYENFPDVGGKVLGSKSLAIPSILTT